MPELIRIRKGLDIRLKGTAERVIVKPEPASSYGVKPIDFYGIVPKLLVQPDDQVKAGTPLFFDKYHPDVLFVSPVSGKVTAVHRGERRIIQEIVVTPDGQDDHLVFPQDDPLSLSRDEVVKTLLKSGCWPYIRQRPYGIIADPKDTPKSIFVSGFDTAPLAPDIDFILSGYKEEFQTGINVLKQLTQGNVFLNIPDDISSISVYPHISNAKITRFKGPHPAGNVGIQIHHLDPINKGDIVWYVNPQDVLILGRLFLHGIYDASKLVALTGSEVHHCRYYHVMAGASIRPMVENNVQSGDLRYISGNVLTGRKIPADGYVGFYDSQVTVIPEGRHFELLGWAMPGFNKVSASRTFFSWMRPGHEYRLDTNMNGAQRAYVLTGQYEKVLPMDIYPVNLIKAILVEDVDLMEKLGIYEASEEDFALCEFVCTSKINVQEIIRNGLDLIRKEMS